MAPPHRGPLTLTLVLAPTLTLPLTLPLTAQLAWEWMGEDFGPPLLIEGVGAPTDVKQASSYYLLAGTYFLLLAVAAY